ncbi:alpha/beta fold hydrolase [Thermoactinomyces sp. DSM 45892]|uniref:alpha/beta fold hydrolase n=1 Tax=Thermoactinomyces sp. DSM 45892 TaxID=1882753 RepID=UPI00089D4EFA|nr:alpha/beta hydrolase [Thermoactinomyces sp. DSM 45892]SDY79862.1 pimeloyl-[acyl-carrier protein] methyl ester esterase [Thermoactinomyces sp. DSM 45892]
MSRKEHAFLWISGWSVPEGIWEPFHGEWPDYHHVTLSFCHCEQVEHVMEQAIQTLGKMEEDEVTVVGWSLGAMVALELALRFPKRISRLFLIGGVADFMKQGHDDIGWDERVLRRMKKQLRSNRQEVIRSFDQKMFSLLEQEDGWQERWQGVFRKHLPSLSSLQAGLDFLQEFSLRDRGKEISTPVFLLTGSEDGICPAEATLHLAKQLPRVECTIWSESGHACFWTQKGRFQQWIKECLHGEHS